MCNQSTSPRRCGCSEHSTQSTGAVPTRVTAPHTITPEWGTLTECLRVVGSGRERRRSRAQGLPGELQSYVHSGRISLMAVWRQVWPMVPRGWGWGTSQATAVVLTVVKVCTCVRTCVCKRGPRELLQENGLQQAETAVRLGFWLELLGQRSGVRHHTHPAGGCSAAGPSLLAFWSVSSCESRLSICPIICCTLLVSLLLALDSSTYISSPVLESSFLISCKS